MGLQLGHAKFRPFTLRETFSNCGLNKEAVGKMCVFQRKTGHISETVRDTATVTINH